VCEQGYEDIVQQLLALSSPVVDIDTLRWTMGGGRFMSLRSIGSRRLQG
jgi:hypothetical protein